MAIDTVKDKIVHARVQLLLRHPFFGNMATRLKVQENNEWCNTAATDGLCIYFNREFFEKLSVKEIEFVIAHEVLHNVFDHFGRREHRNPKLHNIATDYCVNGQLVRDKIGEEPKGINIFHDPKYYDMSSEEIYDKLYDEWDEKTLSQLGQLLDDHIDWSEAGDGQCRPQYTKEELRQIRDGVRDAVVQSAQAAGAGNIPAAIKRMVNELTTPQMDWRALLRQNIQSIIKNDYSFSRPNRKAHQLSVILPGSIVDNAIDICVALDMSGSITDEQAKIFLSEVKGIMEEYRDFKIKIMCFDTQVYNERDYDQYNMDEFMNYEVVGGGGTDFMCIWNHIVDMQYVPKCMVFFTDMYPNGAWGIGDYCETLWIGHGTTTIVPPFGQYAYFTA